jgi:hypothetical protein
MNTNDTRLPIHICEKCSLGHHDDCLRGKDNIKPCNCPTCWNEGQDKINAWRAEKGKKVVGTKKTKKEVKQNPTSQGAKSHFQIRRRTHPRLRIAIGRKGPGGILDDKGKLGKIPYDNGAGD